MTLLPIKIVPVLLAGAMVLWLVGCGKKPEASAVPAPTNQNTASVPAQDLAAAQPVTPTGDTAAATVSDPAELNRELRKWILRNRRPPKSFEDFSSTAGIQIAPPPDGKKYAIDKTMHVVLVKR